MSTHCVTVATGADCLAQSLQSSVIVHYFSVHLDTLIQFSRPLTRTNLGSGVFIKCVVSGVSGMLGLVFWVKCVGSGVFGPGISGVLDQVCLG